MAEAAVTTRLKKLINTPETEVKDAMAGMAAAHADLIRVEYDPNVIIRKDAPRKLWHPHRRTRGRYFSRCRS